MVSTSKYHSNQSLVNCGTNGGIGGKDAHILQKTHYAIFAGHGGHHGMA